MLDGFNIMVGKCKCLHKTNVRTQQNNKDNSRQQQQNTTSSNSNNNLPTPHTLFHTYKQKCAWSVRDKSISSRQIIEYVLFMVEHNKDKKNYKK